MKEIKWIGNSYKNILAYPKSAKREIGYNLDRVQKGMEPIDWKPMPSIGKAVKEIRIHQDNEYRVVYIAKYQEAIYVLHAFIKKTNKTNLQDIKIAKQRLRELISKRGYCYG